MTSHNHLTPKDKFKLLLSTPETDEEKIKLINLIQKEIEHFKFLKRRLNHHKAHLQKYIGSPIQKT